MKKIILAVAVAAVAIMGVAGSALAGPATGISATPAATKPFAGSFSATFVRSASGIINETNRVNSAGAQNEWTPLNVWLQFRPLTNPFGSVIPNPTCDPAGLVTQFHWTNDESTLAGDATSGYFLNGVTYNVCVYYAPNQVVSTGTIDSSIFAGTTAALPTSGNYRIDVSGTYTNRDLNLADAEYTSLPSDNWAIHSDGYDIAPYFLGEGFGDVQVNDAFVNWGAFNTNHAYSLTTALSGTSVNLAVFDGDSTTDTKDAGWYGDNNGSLNYTITYLGQ